MKELPVLRINNFKKKCLQEKVSKKKMPQGATRMESNFTGKGSE